MSSKKNVDLPFAFNRKEAKDHGEGGQIVGAKLQGSILVVDDVITAGTAIREVSDLFKSFPEAKMGAVLIALDRKEVGSAGIGAVDQVSRDFGVPVYSIITLDDLVSYLELDSSQAESLEAIKQYRVLYGTK